MSEGEDDIREAVYLILKTRFDERPMQPDFGCNIEDYVFDLPDEEVKRDIVYAVEYALEKWEPRITNVEAVVNSERMHEGIIIIDINYTVRATNQTKNLVFPYYLEAGQGTWR